MDSLIEQNSERTKWLQIACEIISCSPLPMAAKLAAGTIPAEILVRLAGGRRVVTIRKHVRTIRRLVTWCKSALGKPFPGDWSDVAFFLLDLSKEPCGPSVPKSVLKSLDFIELLGGVRESQRLGRDAQLLNIANDISVEIKPASPVSKVKAPQMVLAVLVASEKTVADTTKPLYVRLHSWTKNIRHWGSLR